MKTIKKLQKLSKLLLSTGRMHGVTGAIYNCGDHVITTNGHWIIKLREVIDGLPERVLACPPEKLKRKTYTNETPVLVDGAVVLENTNAAPKEDALRAIQLYANYLDHGKGHNQDQVRVHLNREYLIDLLDVIGSDRSNDSVTITLNIPNDRADYVKSPVVIEGNTGSIVMMPMHK